MLSASLNGFWRKPFELLASVHSVTALAMARVCSPRRFSGCLRAISAQGCNLDWQRIAYNQPKKVILDGQKNERWGDLRVKPDEFTDWEKRTHCAPFHRSRWQLLCKQIVSREPQTHRAQLSARTLGTPRGRTSQPSINTSLTRTAVLSAVKSQLAASGLDISPRTFYFVCASIESIYGLV